MNEEMMGTGLAATGMDEQRNDMIEDRNELLEQVVQLLMQGASAQELLQMGVPQVLIDEAMAIINAQKGSVNGPVQNAGLAGSQL